MENNFWNYLYETSELIENATNDVTNDNQANISLITKRLNTLELLYDRSFDPVDSYEAFVAVKLISALSKTLKTDF
ncbi:MAG: hypothetical protein V7736_14200 [Colwellia polaris]|jgi:hypothetical protein|uniref:hypothetical protein n=1 Tax=Colwellia polaris TaxID=326537 RepID=UPI000A172D93|nr:hypothetical protein [Colwellia polaris]|tara:strand:- start:3499 stop:3726 length:228 start_codon:yes stop_codon:yes gene_type:complete